jgi:Secretion system C-terminal sorting domain
MKLVIRFLVFFQFASINAQIWPSQTWSVASNLTSVMSSNGIQDLSGLHFNPINNRLYGVQDSGNLRVLQWDPLNNTFSQIADKSLSGGPEGITQANLYANEFYVIDENNYQIKRYTYTSNFSNVNLYKRWNLLLAPSTMTDTGNTGPEGIVFVPDSYLSAIGFISQQTGQVYTSVKGLGGLFFVANQDAGYVWVYDLNPNSNDDFAFVGKYKTNRSESCDLAFDRNTGLLYILHNIAGSNSLEVTNLTTYITNAGNRKFVIANNYDIPITNDINDNIEGFALTPKCGTTSISGVWLCRDIESTDAAIMEQDVLRWFTPYAADGTCQILQNNSFESGNKMTIYPNPAENQLTITGTMIQDSSISIYNGFGQLILKKENQNTTLVLDVSSFEAGIYFVEVNQNNGSIQTLKFSKQ